MSYPGGFGSLTAGNSIPNSNSISNPIHGEAPADPSGFGMVPFSG